ncbi:hypothetical protein AR457_40245 [Streptomyces agglomeratus]|uniref:hypothetical protein n=1 Tax=Streptomyces agglomeratus TaxID=285458 RepID=UPI000852824A|nr:hypothetical protein [Streptomyces agglomeratus]OEJ22117.1 hypothetical protein AR457_40245 [Streptomyces agglomeratus]OEJ36955.1 hypothetical protein BGK70_00900 [Streptomyces agglomeratus]
MTPLLSTSHPWQLHLSETPPPATLPRDFDVVHVGMGLGMSALDTMIGKQTVGPLLCCITHRMLLIPVGPGTADLWGAAHSACTRGTRLTCIARGYQRPCNARFWFAPPNPLAAAITAPAELHDSLSLTRAHMQRPAPHAPFSTQAREVCHV